MALIPSSMMGFVFSTVLLLAGQGSAEPKASAAFGPTEGGAAQKKSSSSQPSGVKAAGRVGVVVCKNPSPMGNWAAPNKDGKCSGEARGVQGLVAGEVKVVHCVKAEPDRCDVEGKKK